jgi:hypothetical protein
LVPHIHAGNFVDARTFPQEIQDKQSSAEPASLQHLLQCPDKHDRSVKVAWPAGPCQPSKAQPHSSPSQPGSPGAQRLPQPRSSIFSTRTAKTRCTQPGVLTRDRGSNKTFLRETNLAKTGFKNVLNVFVGKQISKNMF